MIITVVSMLGSVVVGACIVWMVTRNQRPQLSGVMTQQMPDLGPHVNRVRGLIRAANRGDPNAAMQAAALLDNLEATYGIDAVARACNPDKLRSLIAGLQARRMLPAA